MNEDKIPDELRYKLFKLVDENPELSQREIARRMGVSVGKVNYCLKALIDVGLIKISNFTRSSHKLGYAYLLTPKGVAAKSTVTASFLARKEAEYEALKKELHFLRKEADGINRGIENSKSITENN